MSQLGNLSKAAVALDTLPSIVSRQIAALERPARASCLQAEVKAQQGVISGDVRIGLVPSLAQAVSATLFRTAQQQYPGVKLIIMEGVSAQLDAWRRTMKWTSRFYSGRASRNFAAKTVWAVSIRIWWLPAETH